MKNIQSVLLLKQEIQKITNLHIQLELIIDRISHRVTHTEIKDFFKDYIAEAKQQSERLNKLKDTLPQLEQEVRQIKQTDKKRLNESTAQPVQQKTPFQIQQPAQPKQKIQLSSIPFSRQGTIVSFKRQLEKRMPSPPPVKTTSPVKNVIGEKRNSAPTVQPVPNEIPQPISQPAIKKEETPALFQNIDNLFKKVFKP
jgi:hypothetical protein